MMAKSPKDKPDEATKEEIKPVKSETVEPLVNVTPATGIGTSSGTTTLAVTGVSGSIQNGSTITGTGVPAGTTIIRQLAPITTIGGAGSYLTSAATTLSTVSLTFTVGPTVSFFPSFKPLIPPPVIGLGNPPVPNFPPPTPPPIGAVPVGPLVGPVVAAASVPPSTAGFPLIQYKTGSATSPTAASWIPQFTTTFPHPPIVFSNIFTGGKPPTTPPSTASTICVVLNGWGPNVPPGAPPGTMSAGRVIMAAGAMKDFVESKPNGRPKPSKPL
jgi:hypothetical protein